MLRSPIPYARLRSHQGPRSLRMTGGASYGIRNRHMGIRMIGGGSSGVFPGSDPPPALIATPTPVAIPVTIPVIRIVVRSRVELSLFEAYHVSGDRSGHVFAEEQSSQRCLASRRGEPGAPCRRPCSRRRCRRARAYRASGSEAQIDAIRRCARDSNPYFRTGRCGGRRDRRVRIATDHKGSHTMLCCSFDIRPFSFGNRIGKERRDNPRRSLIMRYSTALTCRRGSP